MQIQPCVWLSLVLAHSCNNVKSQARWKLSCTHEQEEIVPKNILMIGPTGCGKTEIARRLARLADAPFVKVQPCTAADRNDADCNGNCLSPSPLLLPLISPCYLDQQHRFFLRLHFFS